MGTLWMFLLTTLTSGTWTTCFTLRFMMMMTLFIFGITSCATTNFATRWWKFCFSYILRNLTNTGLPWFRKSFHAIFTTTISGLKLFLLFLFVLFLFILRMILWIFSSEEKIFFRTAITSTCLAPLVTKMSSSLIPRHHTNTSLLIFISVCMFALFATIFVSDGAWLFLFHGLFWGDSITDINLIFCIYLLLSFLDAFILPFLLFFRGAATGHWSRRWSWWWRWFWGVMFLLYLRFNPIFCDRQIPNSLIGNILKERITTILVIVIELLISILLLLLLIIIPIIVSIIWIWVLRKLTHIYLLSTWFDLILIISIKIELTILINKL